MGRLFQYQPLAEPFVPSAAPAVPSVAGWMPQAPDPRRRVSALASIALALAFVPVVEAQAAVGSAPSADDGLIRRPRLVQYQAIVRPLLTIAEPVVAPAITPPVYPAWLARAQTHAAHAPFWFGDPQWTAPAPPFAPDYTRWAVYPDVIFRTTLPVSAMQAFAIDRFDPPVIVVPDFFRLGVYPDFINRQTLPIGDYLVFVSDPAWLPPTPPLVAYTTETVVIRRLRRSPHISQEDRWIFYRTFQLDMETGIGLDGCALDVGADPKVMLRWSDDDGETWSNEHWVSAGKIGEYDARAEWRRLGRGRDRVFEVVVSDPVAWNLVAAYLGIQGGIS